jgi:TPR repeat protein
MEAEVTNRTFKAAVAALICAIGFAGSASAATLEDRFVFAPFAPLEDGMNAWFSGDHPKALRLLRPLADEGNAEAQTILGHIYSDGKWGVPRDYVAALSWFRKAADQGAASAQGELALMYLRGHGVPKDTVAAIRWARKATKYGIKVGVAAYDSGDYATSMQILRPLADRDFASPQFFLGLMYANGRGVTRNDATAADWYRKAAEHSEHSGAQINLGLMYENGRGVPQDYAAAIRLYRKAAKPKFAASPAQVTNSSIAQNNLGVMYAYGRGVLQDYVMAHMWYNLAAASGNKDAASNRDFVATRMTLIQIGEAQKRAAEWQAERKAELEKTAAERRARIAGAAPIPDPPQKPSSETFSGTAFFVSRNGNVLTNAHVVEGCRQISVNKEGQSGAAKILARDERNDLALLATDLHPTQTINWRLQARQGEDIVVYGFPLTGVLASGGNVAVGNVTALAGLADDSRFLQISAPVQPGNSGGPLLDRNGTVVGVVVAKLNALEIASATGDIPQNVNFAIKASVAAAFLDAQRVAHPEGGGAGALSTPDIAERAKAFTVQVICVR